MFALKPLSVLETGTYVGKGSVSLARALRKNGTGRLTTVDSDANALSYARKNLETEQLSDWVDVVESDSFAFLETTDRRFDFALFDSVLSMRTEEIEICLRRGLLRPGSFFAIHDTSKSRVNNWDFIADPDTPCFWYEFARISGIRYVEFPYSRGLVLAQVTP